MNIAFISADVLLVFENMNATAVIENIGMNPNRQNRVDFIRIFMGLVLNSWGFNGYVRISSTVTENVSRKSEIHPINLKITVSLG